jgi:hypothetical protein
MIEGQTDGCSGGMSKTWKKLFSSLPPWEGCCDTHDLAYAAGGTRGQRRKADLRLAECVAKRGFPTIAAAMFVAVRLFGGPHWPRSRRWGYAALVRGYVPEPVAA